MNVYFTKIRKKIYLTLRISFEQYKRAHAHFYAYSHQQDNSYSKFLRNIVPSSSVICTQAAFPRYEEERLEADPETSYPSFTVNLFLFVKTDTKKRKNKSLIITHLADTHGDMPRNDQKGMAVLLLFA